MRNLKKSMIAALTTTMLMSGISVPAMAADDDGTVTLTIWNNEVMAPGLQDNDVAKVIEERL